MSVPESFVVIHDEISEGDPELQGFVATAEQVRNSLTEKGNFASIIYPDHLTSIFIADYTSPYFFDFKEWTEDDLDGFVQDTKANFTTMYQSMSHYVDGIECYVHKTNHHIFVITGAETHDNTMYYGTINAQTMLSGRQVVFVYDCSFSSNIEKDIHTFMEILGSFKAK